MMNCVVLVLAMCPHVLMLNGSKSSALLFISPLHSRPNNKIRLENDILWLGHVAAPSKQLRAFSSFKKKQVVSFHHRNAQVFVLFVVEIGVRAS